MKVSIICSIFLLIGLSTFGPSAKPKTISIQVEPLTTTRYRITVEFRGDNSGKTRLQLPASWGGQQELYNAVHDLSAKPVTAIVQQVSAKNERLIQHKPAEKLSVTYELEQDFKGPLKTEIRYRPVTDPTWIHWIGNTVWVLPAWDDDEKVSVSLSWERLPKTWTVANSLGAGSLKQRIATEFGNLRSAVYVAGDFRLNKTTVAGDPLFVAVRGEWQFTDGALTEEIRRVIEAERGFWNDHSQDFYLVTLVPTNEGPNALSFGGTGLHDSFALFATPNASIPRLRTVLAHEYAHNWIPTRLGKFPDPEQSMYWFSEGFTEYYTYQLLFRSGLITKDELIGNYNSLIREYYLSPVRTASNQRIVSDFWKDQNVQRLPYLRGFMIAVGWNSEILRFTVGKHSLDDVVLDLFRSAKAGGRELSLGLISEKISGLIKKDISQDLSNQVVNGEPIVPAADALGTEVELVTEAMPVFELGFDLNELRTKRTIAGVVEGSNAYAAGLRNGQTLAGGLSFAFGDTSKPIEIRVRENGAERTVKYVPASAKPVEIPQHKLRLRA